MTDEWEDQAPPPTVTKLKVPVQKAQYEVTVEVYSMAAVSLVPEFKEAMFSPLRPLASALHALDPNDPLAALLDDAMDRITDIVAEVIGAISER
jgi:hypothetical protein